MQWPKQPDSPSESNNHNGFHEEEGIPSPPPHHDDGWGFKEFFLLGVFVGFIYTLLRYPATWGCLFLVGSILIVLVIIFYWQWLALLSLGIFGVWWLRKQHREEQWPFR